MVLSDSPANPDVDGRVPHRIDRTAPAMATERPFRPVRPLGRVTWLARSGGEWVAARPLPFLVDGWCGRPDVTVAQLPREAGSRHLIPFAGLAVADGSPWAVSEYVPGAPLDRLLTVATLTPRQAATVAIEIFAGLAALHASGLVHGRLRTRAVRVGTDGVVRLADWVVGPLDRSTGPGWPERADDPAVAAGRLADLAAAGRIVAELARNADRPVVHRDGFEAELVTGLARMAVSEPMQATLAEAELRHLLDAVRGGAPTRPNVHAELGALVTAANRRLPDTAEPPPDGADADAPATRPGRAAPPLRRGRLSGADWHGRRRRHLVWAAGATVAVLAAGALALTVGPGRSIGDRILHRHPAAAAGPSASPAPTRSAPVAARPRPAPSVAPAAAGIVHKVSARATTRCAPARPCRLRVTIRITPSPNRRRLHWAVTVYDRCTGARSTRPGGVLAAAPGATSLSATRTVALPRGRALAVTAFTTRPARAAAAPLYAPARARGC
jgi:hypothetical protein